MGRNTAMGVNSRGWARYRYEGQFGDELLKLAVDSRPSRWSRLPRIDSCSSLAIVRRKFGG